MFLATNIQITRLVTRNYLLVTIYNYLLLASI